MAFFLLSPLLLVTAEWHALRALLRTLHHWKVALLLSFISGPPNSRLTQALESDENDWNTLVSFATHLGDQWVETTTVWQSGYQTGVVAQWTSQLGGDEENGWEKSRRTFQRELQRNPKDNFAWGIYRFKNWIVYDFLNPLMRKINYAGLQILWLWSGNSVSHEGGSRDLDYTFGPFDDLELDSTPSGTSLADQEQWQHSYA